MKIAWVQLNSLPKEYSLIKELLHLIRSKAAFCGEVFLFFTQFPSEKSDVEKIRKEIVDKLPSNIHLIFAVRSQSSVKDAIETLCYEYENDHNYNDCTVSQIGQQTDQELKSWNNDYVKKVSLVKGSFHFYSNEVFSVHEGSLFSLHLNTSVSSSSSSKMGEKSLLYPTGIDRGFSDHELREKLNDSKTGIAIGEKGSSFWMEQERKQLINCITYDKKIILYLCGGETTKVISHNSRFLVGKFTEIQLDSDSCVIGFIDLACNTGSATHYTCDRVNLKWEKDSNFARNVSVNGVMDTVFFPKFSTTIFTEGVRTEVAGLAKVVLNITPPAFRVLNWEVDHSQANTSYLKILAKYFYEEISHEISGQEDLFYYFVYGNDVTPYPENKECAECASPESCRIFIFQSSIDSTDILPPHTLVRKIFHKIGSRRIPNKTAIILLRVHKCDDNPLPEATPFPTKNGIEVPVESTPISFGWLNYPILVFSDFIEKYTNPEKLRGMPFAIAKLHFDIDNDISVIATPDVSPTNETEKNADLDISEKHESIESYNLENRRSNVAEKGGDRDGR